jgi:outer membrane protein OmpA-like peptidoglycan-associated protein
MRTHLRSILAVGLLACGGSAKHASTPADGTSGSAVTTTGATDASGAAPKPKPKEGDAGAFDVKDTDKSSRPNQGTLKPTATEAAVRLFVVDKGDNNKPIEGIAISLTAPDGKKYYTEETNAEGFTEVLVPIGQTYGVNYLSLGRHDVSAKVDVANKPNLNLKLTMRYQTDAYPTGLVLHNVEFPSGKATLIGESEKRLDVVVEYMTHKKSVRIEIAGHTDNVGDKKVNKALSQKRADAVRDYLVSKGIDGARIKAVGYGDTKPTAPNTTPEGRQENRRIEAHEL